MIHGNVIRPDTQSANSVGVLPRLDHVLESAYRAGRYEQRRLTGS